jgi:hypothetical protein
VHFGHLTALARALDKGGRVFFTTFVEEGVPPVSVNPEGYRVTCSGPLHVVRCEKQHLFSIIDQAGFTLTHFSYRLRLRQSGLYLSRTHA